MTVREQKGKIVRHCLRGKVSNCVPDSEPMRTAVWHSLRKNNSVILTLKESEQHHNTMTLTLKESEQHHDTDSEGKWTTAWHRIRRKLNNIVTVTWKETEQQWHWLRRRVNTQRDTDSEGKWTRVWHQLRKKVNIGITQPQKRTTAGS